MISLQDTAHLPVEPAPIPRPATPTSGAAPPERGRRRGQPVENPYANVGRLSAVYTPAKPQRRKSPLVKQGQVEEGAQAARDPSPLGGARIPHSGIADISFLPKIRDCNSWLIYRFLDITCKREQTYIGTFRS